MRHGLDQAEVAVEGVLGQILAVAGGRHRADLYIRVPGEYFQQRVAYERYGVAEVGPVVGEEYLRLLVNHHQLDGGRSGVYSDVHASGVILRKIRARDAGALVPGLEGVVLRLRFKERRHGAVARGQAALTHALRDVVQVELLVGVKSRAHGDVIEAVIRAEPAHAERPVKALTQHVGEGQRPAQIQYIALYRPALGQSGNRLIDDSLVDTCSNIFCARTLVDERLYVAFGKNAAARGDGVSLFCVPRGGVHFVRAELQQRSHLVDERACASRA